MGDIYNKLKMQEDKNNQGAVVADEQIDWLELKREQEACHEAMKKIEEDDSNPLNNLIFGLGQPLKVYW